MNKENMNELLNQAKEAATTEEAKSLIDDLEVLIDLYNRRDTAGEGFAQNVKEAQERFLISLGKAAANMDMGAGMFPKTEEYSPEQLEKIYAMQKGLEETVSSISTLQKLKNHTKVRS